MPDKPAAHTPTPWESTLHIQESGDVIIRRVYLDEQGRRCTQFVASVHCTAGHEDEQIPTAELVVRAVNAHEALVAALTELLRVDDEWHGSVNSEMSHARSQARAAIALVKGEA